MIQTTNVNVNMRAVIHSYCRSGQCRYSTIFAAGNLKLLFSHRPVCSRSNLFNRSMTRYSYFTVILFTNPLRCVYLYFHLKIPRPVLLMYTEIVICAHAISISVFFCEQHKRYLPGIGANFVFVTTLK